MKTKLLRRRILSFAITVCVVASMFFINAYEVSAATSLNSTNVTKSKLSKDDKASLKQMFDASYYALAYADVDKSLGITDFTKLSESQKDQLFDHFCQYGIYEQREISAAFSVCAYAAAYSDLRSAFGNDVVAYYRHYINYGRLEGRKLVTINSVSAAGYSIYSIDAYSKGSTGVVNPGASLIAKAYSAGVDPATVLAIEKSKSTYPNTTTEINSKHKFNNSEFKDVGLVDGVYYRYEITPENEIPFERIKKPEYDEEIVNGSARFYYWGADGQKVYVDVEEATIKIHPGYILLDDGYHLLQ